MISTDHNPLGSAGAPFAPPGMVECVPVFWVHWAAVKSWRRGDFRNAHFHASTEEPADSGWIIDYLLVVYVSWMVERVKTVGKGPQAKKEYRSVIKVKR